MVCYTKISFDLDYKLTELHLIFGHINISNCIKLNIFAQFIIFAHFIILHEL